MLRPVESSDRSDVVDDRDGAAEAEAPVLWDTGISPQPGKGERDGRPMIWTVANRCCCGRILTSISYQRPSPATSSG
jgi:hypothetical protein